MLLSHLPDAPICSADELDAWIGDIWEPYYNQCEEDAKQLGGLFLDKFYDEGSFATLVAVWKVSDEHELEQAESHQSIAYDDYSLAMLR